MLMTSIRQNEAELPDKEGVIKYRVEHVAVELEDALTSVCASERISEILERVTELDDARTRLHELNLSGSMPTGIGFGNLSLYLAHGAFIISGSGTGEPRVLGRNGYCLVRQACPERNQFCSTGPMRASSESMTHAAVYSAFPMLSDNESSPIRCVIHVHSPALFSRYLPVAPQTPVTAAYGTPELAQAVRQLVSSMNVKSGFFVLAGHQDGLVFFGPTIKCTWENILSAL